MQTGMRQGPEIWIRGPVTTPKPGPPEPPTPMPRPGVSPGSARTAARASPRSPRSTAVMTAAAPGPGRATRRRCCWSPGRTRPGWTRSPVRWRSSGAVRLRRGSTSTASSSWRTLRAAAAPARPAGQVPGGGHRRVPRAVGTVLAARRTGPPAARDGAPGQADGSGTLTAVPLSAGEIAAGVRARQLRAVDVVAAALERIDRADPELCAFVEVWHEESLRRAGEVDALLDRGSWNVPRTSGADGSEHLRRTSEALDGPGDVPGGSAAARPAGVPRTSDAEISGDAPRTSGADRPGGVPRASAAARPGGATRTRDADGLGDLPSTSGADRPGVSPARVVPTDPGTSPARVAPTAPGVSRAQAQPTGKGAPVP